MKLLGCVGLAMHVSSSGQSSTSGSHHGRQSVSTTSFAITQSVPDGHDGSADEPPQSAMQAADQRRSKSGHGALLAAGYFGVLDR